VASAVRLGQDAVVNDPVEELAVQYGDLIGVIGSVSEEEAWLPTGCLGFAVRDLVLHVLSDAQRALVALAAPVDREPDRDAVTYWRDSPGPDDPQWRSLRALRTMASAYGLESLKRDWRETGGAVVALAARTDRSAVVGTQGHALAVPDLAATLVFESAVHHLDLVAHLDRPGPRPGPLRVVRATLDGLLGRPVPLGWDDVTYARKATGRQDVTPGEAEALGVAGPRFSLIP
jgi:hypothetical protein